MRNYPHMKPTIRNYPQRSACTGENTRNAVTKGNIPNETVPVRTFGSTAERYVLILSDKNEIRIRYEYLRFLA